MANFFLYWNPANNKNSTTQLVQYKLSTSSTWITAATVGKAIDSYYLSGLTDNVFYDFRICNNCTAGGPLFSPPKSGISLTCPTLTVSSNGAQINYSFPTVSGTSVNKYIVELYKNDILNTFNTYNSPFAPTITDNFSGVDYSNNNTYKVRVLPYAGTTYKECPLSDSILVTCVNINDFDGTLN